MLSATICNLCIANIINKPTIAILARFYALLEMYSGFFGIIGLLLADCMHLKQGDVLSMLFPGYFGVTDL